MTTFKLNKASKGKKFLYTVTDEKGTVLSTRSSARDYVACTTNGEFYFGRLDLIGKGDHGRLLARANAFLSNPEADYKNAINFWAPSFREEKKRENPFDKYCEWQTKWANGIIDRLTKIAYL